MSTDHTVYVRSGENLSAILRAFPRATVDNLISEPGSDSWRVHFFADDPAPRQPDTDINALVRPGAIDSRTPPPALIIGGDDKRLSIRIGACYHPLQELVATLEALHDQHQGETSAVCFYLRECISIAAKGDWPFK